MRSTLRKGNDRKLRLDNLHQAIIEVLQEDATIPVKDLAKRVHSSVATVSRRITRLKHSDMMRIVAVANPFKLGFSVVAIFLLKIDQSRMRKVNVLLGKMKELRFVGVTIGGYDMVGEAWFRSTDDMLTFTTDVLARVPGISRVETLQILEMITYTYDWGKRR